MVMVSIGSVILDFLGAAVLKSTVVIVDGHATNSATGVFSYIAIASGAFAIAAVLVVMLVRSTRPSSDWPSPDLERNAVR
jgi:hypothetical protein